MKRQLTDEQKERRLAYQKKWQQSPKGIAYLAAYKSKPEVKAKAADARKKRMKSLYPNGCFKCLECSSLYDGAVILENGWKPLRGMRGQIICCLP